MSSFAMHVLQTDQQIRCSLSNTSSREVQKMSRTEQKTRRSKPGGEWAKFVRRPSNCSRSLKHNSTLPCCTPVSFYQAGKKKFGQCSKETGWFFTKRDQCSLSHTQRKSRLKLDTDVSYSCKNRRLFFVHLLPCGQMESSQTSNASMITIFLCFSSSRDTKAFADRLWESLSIFWAKETRRGLHRAKVLCHSFWKLTKSLHANLVSTRVGFLSEHWPVNEMTIRKKRLPRLCCQWGIFFVSIIPIRASSLSFINWCVGVVFRQNTQGMTRYLLSRSPPRPNWLNTT